MNKIKKETQIFWLNEDRLIKWSDIKHLQLEEDDVIRSSWEGENGDGYYVGEIIRMVEETDEQFQKRLVLEEEHREYTKKLRYERYLKLKKEFETE
jgi:hypothetical protein